MAQPQNIQLRIDTSTNWTAADPTLLKGEVGLESNTGRFKVGDGVTAWTSLGYFPELGVQYLKSYTVAQAATLTPASYTRGLIWVSDESGGAQPAYCDGTNWRRFSDGAIIS